MKSVLLECSSMLNSINARNRNEIEFGLISFYAHLLSFMLVLQNLCLTWNFIHFFSVPSERPVCMDITDTKSNHTNKVWLYKQDFTYQGEDKYV